MVASYAQCTKFSSPPRGIVYIYAEMESVNQPLPQVLVPSTGNLYIYGIVDGERYWITTGSRPLHGESIYLLRGATDVRSFPIQVLVPSTGNLYLYDIRKCEKAFGSVLVPLHGDSFSLWT